MTYLVKVSDHYVVFVVLTAGVAYLENYDCI